MGLFDGIGQAQIGVGGVYFEPGEYEVEVVEVKAIMSRKRENLYIVAARILQSSNPDRPIGVKASWIVNMKQDAALGDIKGFLAACNGADASNEDEVARVLRDEQGNDLTEAMAEYSVHEDQPLAGVRLHLITFQRPTKAGGMFTIHNWSPSKLAA